MYKEVILVPNLICSECYMVVQCNVTQKLISTTGLSQWHYSHAVIATEVWGLISPRDQNLNDQPTTP